MVFVKKTSRSGFSLVEMLVAVVVLSILFIMMTQLFTESLLTMNGSGKHLSADGQARLIFNRIGDDFSGMLKRNDVDFIFYKPELTGGTGSGANDSLFFYSQAPAYLSNADSTNSSSIALLGYRVDSNASDANYQQLERLGQGLTWDNSSSTTAGVLFLTWNPSTGFNSSSLLSAWNAIGNSPYNTVASTLSSGTYGASYEIMGDQVFRYEFCFLLKDGSYSDGPVLSVVPSGWNNNYTFFTQSTSSPTPANGQNGSGTGGYTAGSRWYNTSTGEAFICTNATPNNASWTGAGIQDVSAIIVTLAILDNNSRKMITTVNASTALNAVAANLTDSGLLFPTAIQNPAPTLPAATWNKYIANHLTTLGIPNQVANQIRIYQRYFYINPQTTTP